MPKFTKRNTTKIGEICTDLMIKTQERRQGRRSGVFIVNFEHISHIFLFLLLTLSTQLFAGFENLYFFV